MSQTPPRSVVLGIGGLLGHDANAALIVDGRLIASSQEERHTRLKHDGTFPRHAIAECLALAGLDSRDVTDVVFAEKALQSHLFDLTGRSGNAFTRSLGRVLPEGWGNLYGQQARALLPQANFHHVGIISRMWREPFIPRRSSARRSSASTARVKTTPRVPA